MKKNKFNEQSAQVLNLGNLHEEIQQQEKNKKNSIVPLILVFCGVCLIASGIFYKDIEKVFNKITNPSKEEVKKEKTGITILSCSYSNSDKTLGLEKDRTIIYKFKDNLLKEVNDKLEVSINKNSYDIGSNNINVYKKKYDEALGNISVEGLTINIKLEKEVLTKQVISNFEVLDITKVPKANYLTISNKKDQPYREIKEIEGKAGHICKVSYE
ncbi:MAG: hypothetical protein J6A17_03450 [Bacilli bacterium]|nr:hypothetical protein [Bacilli bacterium]